MKAVSDLFCPVKAEVLEVNVALDDEPQGSDGTGEVQDLDAGTMFLWGNSSAYFNGDSVKVELIERLAGAGLRCIEVTSFVSPKWIPQLADADALAGSFEAAPGVSYVAAGFHSPASRAARCAVMGPAPSTRISSRITTICYSTTQ